MTKPNMPESSHGLTGRRVFLILAAFFGTIASADAFLIVAAVRTHTGTEATSAYQAGQLFNGEIKVAREHAARGWRLDMEAERNPDGRGATVVVEGRGDGGAALAGHTLAAVLQRPTDKREDRAVPLTEVAPGRYAGSVAELAPGQWDLVVDVLEGESWVFRRKARVVLR
jgi:nitrogen fixation protein FixH